MEDVAVTISEQTIQVGGQTVEQVAVTEKTEIVDVPAAVDESIDVTALEETVSVVGLPVPVQGPVEIAGLIPYVELTPVDNLVTLDCSLGLAFRVDCSGLFDMSILTVQLANWPAVGVVEVYVLLYGVPAGGIGVVWPQVKQLSNSPVGRGISNEYLLRSWDGGNHIGMQRIGWYYY